MKKRFHIPLILALFATVSSCKKDFTCECSADDDDFYVIYQTKKKTSDAELWCNAWDNSGQTIDGWRCTLSAQ